jgi:hypothetical protein
LQETFFLPLQVSYVFTGAKRSDTISNTINEY